MTKIIQRHDTSTNWTSVNPILALGEMGIETDTNKFKFGDGITNWTSLSYASAEGGGGADLSNYYTKDETYNQEEVDTLLDEKQDALSPVLPIELKKVTLSKTHNCTFVDDSLYANVKSWWTLDTNSATLSVTDGTNSYIDFPLDLNNQNNKVVTFSRVGTAQTNATNVTTALGKLDANGDFYPIILLACVGNSSYGYYTLATELNTTTVSGTRASYTIPSTGQGIPTDICGLGITKVTDTQLYLSGVGSKYGARIGTFNSEFIKDINNVRVYSTTEGSIYLKKISDYGIYQGSANIGYNYSALAKFVKGVLNGEYTNEYDLSEITILNQINLKYDNQTIQVNSDGELVANLDELGNEVNTLAGRVTGVETNLTDKADVDGTNMVASVKNFDGQWVIDSRELFQTTTVGTYTVDLSTYLPDDGYIYDVIFNHRLYATTDVAVSVISDLIAVGGQYQYVGQTSGNARWSCNRFTMPVGTGRTVQVQTITNNASQNYLSVIGYRRLGTNQ